MLTDRHQVDSRSLRILEEIVEHFVASGEPVGSRTLSQINSIGVSAATVRNSMSDLERLGYLYAPHTSAGRLPTELGIRMYVDGLLQVGNLNPEEAEAIKVETSANDRSFNEILEEATSKLSNLSACAGMVLAPKTETSIRHVEFVPLAPKKALVILITEAGLVENRVMEIPDQLPVSVLSEAGNFLSARFQGRTLDEARKEVENELIEHRAELDGLTQKVVESGIATVAGENSERMVIVRGQSKLLDDVSSLSDLDRIRSLFSALETKENAMKLLESAEGGSGVQIFVGSHTEMFDMTGCSMVLSPYNDAEQSVVGAIGVIGPLNMNYRQVVPMVDYTAKAIGQLLNKS